MTRSKPNLAVRAQRGGREMPIQHEKSTPSRQKVENKSRRVKPGVESRDRVGRQLPARVPIQTKKSAAIPGVFLPRPRQRQPQQDVLLPLLAPVGAQLEGQVAVPRPAPGRVPAAHRAGTAGRAGGAGDLAVRARCRLEVVLLAMRCDGGKGCASWRRYL